jgi:hypothetical protein
MLGMNSGLNLANVAETSPQELADHLSARWATRGPLYDMYATSLLADYDPEFLKLHQWGNSGWRIRPSHAYERGPEMEENTLPSSIGLLCTYMQLGWETGIRNQLKVLTGWGFTRPMFMEVVAYGRLTAGMRGLGHVYHAIGDMLPDMKDGHGNPRYPEGWAADPAAFKSGLDLSTRDLTAADRANLTAWYEKTIGYLPRSIQFGMKHDPQFLKAHRAMWETAIKTLPKQVVPYIMLRDATVANDREALREAALLGKAWGLTNDWLVRGVTHVVGFTTGLRGMYACWDAMDDILGDGVPSA